MPSEILHVGAEFDVSPLVSGAQQAGTAVEKMAARIKASGLSAEETASALINFGFSEQEAAQAANTSTATTVQQQVAIDEDARALVGFNSILAGTVLSEKELANALVGATAATGKQTGGVIEARLATDLLTGNFGRAEQALVRFAARTEIIGPLIGAAFPVFAAVAFGEILLQMGEKAYKAYEDIVLLKGSIEALDKATMAEAEHAAALNYQYEEGLARRLEAQGNLTEAAKEYQKAASDKPLELPKIDDKMFKQFNSDFVSFLQSVHTSADAPSVISRINAEAGSTQEQLDKAKKTLEGMSEISGEALAYGGGAALEHQTKLVQDLSDKLGFLKGIIGEVQSQQGIADNEEGSRLAHTGKSYDKLADATDKAKLKTLELQAASESVGSGTEARVTKLQAELAALGEQEQLAADIAAREASRDNENPLAARAQVAQDYAYKQKEIENELAALWAETVDKKHAAIQAEESLTAEEETFFAKSEIAKTARLTAENAKRITEEQGRATQSIEINESIAMQEITAQESAAEHDARMQELRVSGSTLSAATKARLIGDIQASELAQLQDFENQKYAVELEAKKKELELAMGGQTQQEFFSGGASPEQLTQYARIKNEMAELDAKHAAASQILNDRITESGLQAAIKIEHAWDSAANNIASNYNSAFNNIMNGTMTVGRSFEQMASRMVNSVVLHLQDLVIKWAAHELQMVVIHATANEAKVTSDAAAAAQSSAISSAMSLKEIVHAAGVAAAKTWAAVSEIPVVGPFLAPVAAAAAFAGVMAFEALGSAEQGAVVPSNQLIFAHQNEMILPAHLSQGIQSMIESGQGGGGHTFNIGTINTASPADFMKQLKTMAKRGQLRI